MIYEPRQKNKAPEMLILALFSCATLSALFSSWDAVKGRGILQSIAIIFFGIMIYVLVRYKYTRIRYTVRLKKEEENRDNTDADDEEREKAAAGCVGKKGIKSVAPQKLEFAVEQSQGKRGFVTECVIDLADITLCRPLPAEKAEQKKMLKSIGKGNSYKYLRNIVGAEKWIMAAKTDRGSVKIFFEPGSEMGDYLSAVAGYNKSTDNSAD